MMAGARGRGFVFVVSSFVSARLPERAQVVELVEHLWQLADLDALVRTSRKEAFVRARSRLWSGMGLASLHEKRLADGDEAAPAAKKQKPLAEDEPAAAP